MSGTLSYDPSALDALGNGGGFLSNVGQALGNVGSNFANNVGNMFSDPTTMGLLGLAQGFGQMAMPSRMPVPFGAVMGNAAGGLMRGEMEGIQGQQAQNQLAQQQLQTQFLKNQSAMMNRMQQQQAAGGMGGGQAPRDPNAPLISPQLAANMAMLMAMNPQSARGAAPWLDYLRSFAPNGGGAYVTAAGGVQPTAGALGTTAARTLATNVPEAQVKLAYDAGRIPIQYQQALNEANIGSQADWNSKVVDFGNGVKGTAAQVIGPYQPIGGQGNPLPSALASLPDDKTRVMAINAMIGANLPQQAWAPWIARVQTESGWNLNTPDSKTGAIGPGQVEPGTGQMLGYTPDQLRDPQQNLLASAKYFAQQWQRSGGNPIGAFTGYNAGSPNATPEPGTVQDSLNHLASYSGQQLAPGIYKQGGGAQGPVTITSTRPQQELLMKNDLEEEPKIADELISAQQNQTKLIEARDLAAKLPTGANAQTRGAISNLIATYFPSLQGKLPSILQIPDDAAAWQAFNKLSFQGSTSNEREALGARGGARATEMFLKGNPGIENQPDMNRQIFNMQLIGNQANQDYLNGLQQYINKNAQDFDANKGNYVPSTQFDHEWNTQRNPQVYYAAMQAINGKPFDAWSKGLSKAEGLRALQIIGRADPSATIMGSDGKPLPVTQFLPQAPQ